MGVENTISMEEVILKAAENLFLNKGFAMTSTTEIAADAGCNQALVHYYFRTKERLFTTIFEQKAKMFASILFTIDNEGGTFLDKLKRKIEAHFDMLVQNPRLPFLLINEITTNPKRIEDIKASLDEISMSIAMPFKRDIDGAIEEGLIREISLPDLVVSIVSMNVGMFVVAPVFKSVFHIDDEQFSLILENRKREVVTMILNGLKPVS